MDMTAHIIFDVNLDAGITRRDRLISEGHKLYTTTYMKYKSVITRDSVWIVLIWESLNILYVKSADVHNSYLN